MSQSQKVDKLKKKLKKLRIKKSSNHLDEGEPVILKKGAHSDLLRKILMLHSAIQWAEETTLFCTCPSDDETSSEEEEVCPSPIVLKKRKLDD